MSKYKELLNFSKQFIKGTLPPCTQIHGIGANGKTTFVYLLTNISDANTIKIHPKNLEDEQICEKLSGFNNIIIDGHKITTDLIALVEKISLKTDAKFILISNDAPIIPSIMTLEMNAKFTNENQHKKLFAELKNTRDEEIFNYIMTMG